MKKALHIIFTESRFTVFHTCMAGMFITGAMVATSASDLGPFEPLLVAAGLTGCFFSSACEFLFVIRLVASLAIKKFMKVNRWSSE